MPYSKCPCCRDVSHLNVTNIAEWYRHYYPDIPVGSLVPGKCFYCWPELHHGDAVVIRDKIGSSSQTPVGMRGHLVEVLSATEHGTIYHVQLESGGDRFFVRGELRKLREDE